MTNEEPNSNRILPVDVSSSKKGSGVRIRLMSTGEVLEQSFRLIFLAPNNEAEYEALIVGLRLAHGPKIHNIHTYCDFQLVASQYRGKYETKDERMYSYLKIVQNLAQIFDQFALTLIPRAENAMADALDALASSSDSGLTRVIPMEFIEYPSIGPLVIINLIDSPDGDVDEINVKAIQDSEQSE